ncbi:MAG: PCMD domain-containing protein [Muribaculaceae bacterium]|nr:PCMD domain-containing protein [Muribaculaceae bacterium]
MKFIANEIAVTVAIIALAALSTSCFKEEPLNAECDIEKAWVHVDNVDEMFYNATDTLIDVLSTENKIVFTMRDDANVTALAPQFTITDGATITPANGSMHDFSKGPVTYTVTSQDGKWSRAYTVECNRVAHFVTEVMNFDFEHYELDPNNGNSYYIWHNTLPDGTLGNDWASGNAGFKLSMKNALPEEYPTSVLTDGYEGNGVLLITRSTGKLGQTSKKPIAAGNMFLGKFNLSKAMTKPMEATEFGIPFTQKPLRLSGYYQYSPSSPFIDKNFNEYPDRIDAGDIYSVLYINHDEEGNPFVLFGDNVLSSDKIVAVARVNNVNETNGQWVHFDVEFEYSQDIDLELLANRGYSLTIVFSSSIEGATFEGAIGSTLKVDKVQLTCEIKE